ncbi:SDR family NAD(P)-dependent oxidoreductase [Legionella waltersii]|uniref:Oxidoreductase n=1 Tax=Legionella waltersii TaxID=66969 RepID=A0A0W1A766_9GAMM|nr:SDR family NAD(P)-dependent oxidoreductase [Legionella waltersii]KTD77158.1 oxidoreductase [Legionella waltersii]SNV11402.1 oxidoreductase [Legionella waltersii]
MVVTGISRGIGFAIAKLFLQKGWRVFGTSTNGHKPLEHKNLHVYAMDLSDSNQIHFVAQQLPEVTLLINNAAILLEAWGETTINMDQLKHTFSVNVFGTIEFTELCFPKLKKDGQIITMSSGWGTFSSNDSAAQPHYKMSKACLNMYTMLLAERFPHITVSAFDPGWVKTDMGSDDAPTLPSETAKEIYDLVIRKKRSGCLWHRNYIREW